VSTSLQDPLSRLGTPPSVTTVAYAGNQIPATRFDKNSLLLIGKFFPLPNQPAAAGLPLNNYQYLTKTPVDKNQFNQRIDFKPKLEVAMVRPLTVGTRI